MKKEKKMGFLANTELEERMGIRAGLVLPWTTVLLSTPLKTSENSKRLGSSLTSFCIC